MENQKPNKLIIIGNGFDLAHNLPTKYEDFMLWVLEQDIQKINKGLDTNILENIGYGMMDMDDSKKSYEIKNLKDYCSLLIEKNHKRSHTFKIKNSLFEQLLTNQVIQNWVDIEQEYYNSLIAYFINKRNINPLNRDFEQMKSLLEQYLISIKDVNIRAEPKISTFFKELPKFDKTKTLHPVLICNFNYTGSLDTYIREETDMTYNDICFIHGEIERPKNPIVFGYGDEKEEHYLPMESRKDDKYLKYIKSFAYLKTPNYSKLLSFIEAEPFEVVIMGHSCGQSDRVLLKTIFEHDHCEKIIIKYHKRPNGTDDFDEKAKEIARSFTDKALFRKRVVHYQDERVTSLT